jgi:hypothetical protein
MSRDLSQLSTMTVDGHLGLRTNPADLPPLLSPQFTQ